MASTVVRVQCHWTFGAPVFLVIALVLLTYGEFRPTKFQVTVSDIFFIAAAAVLMLSRRVVARPFGNYTLGWFVMLTLMLGALFISSMINGNPVDWVVVASQYAFAFGVLPLLLMGQGEFRWTMMAKALVFGVVAIQFFSILIYFGENLSLPGIDPFFEALFTGARRLEGLAGNPNQNAASIVMVFPVMFYLRGRQMMGPTTLVLSSAILLMALMLSASVTGTAAFVVVVVVFALIAGVRIRIYHVGLVCFVVGLFVLGVFDIPSVFERRVGDAVATGELQQAGRFLDRADLASKAWAICQETVLVGMGADQFRQVHDGDAVHVLILLLWSEGGLVALLSFMMMVALLVVGALSVVRFDRLVAGLALSAVVAFVVFSLASPHMYARSWSVPLILAMAPAFSVFLRREFRSPSVMASER